MNGMMIPAAALAVCAAATGASGAEKPTLVRTTGEATVKAMPDTAAFQFSVVTFGEDAKTASAENAGRTEAILKKLKAALPADADVETEGYSIEPQRKYPKGGGGPGEITGYTVRNSVNVRMKGVEKLSGVLDVVTQAGADQVNWVRFELDNPDELRARALREAVGKARASADVIADALGMRVLRTASVDEQGTAQPRPMMMMQARGAMNESAPPMEPGEVEVRAQVTVETEVGP